MQVFLILVLIVFGILSLVLFFKVWGMCNNVSNISDDIKVIKDISLTQRRETYDSGKYTREVEIDGVKFRTDDSGNTLLSPDGRLFRIYVSPTRQDNKYALVRRDSKTAFWYPTREDAVRGIISAIKENRITGFKEQHETVAYIAETYGF